jgi:ribosomal protein L12E/L44/L45/RPP1/RPP2
LGARYRKGKKNSGTRWLQAEAPTTAHHGDGDGDGDGAAQRKGSKEEEEEEEEEEEDEEQILH